MPRESFTSQGYQTALARHFPARWGRHYLPMQSATVGSAPSSSKPGYGYSELLQRDMHRMSRAEKPFIPLALYNNKLFELKDQFGLPLTPSPHALVGHPKASGMVLPDTTGTLACADRLGLMRHHPRVPVSDAASGTVMAPWPIRGDFLLFLTDHEGHYCVDWDVKRDSGDHGRPGPGDVFERLSPRKIDGARAIREIHLECMREQGIPVKAVAFDQLDPVLVHNLQRLFLLHAQPIDLSPQCVADVLGALQFALKIGRPPNEVFDDFMAQGVCHVQATRVMNHAIWYRHLRIDLYRPWVADRPLEPEVRDPLVELAHLFDRGA